MQLLATPRTFHTADTSAAAGGLTQTDRQTDCRTESGDTVPLIAMEGRGDTGDSSDEGRVEIGDGWR
ncbi:hypothetical protein TWF481_010020 [Arthrobotrys musiformis]|uniref:Uncharacterized protein n=1 Tax=Arthrobotrys musiformis TaxID=47236 RepID=A0AAV9VZN2_9PEZI